MTVEVIDPHGFCAGVTAALRKALKLTAAEGPVYCLHELVHNEIVVGDLRRRGFVFVESVEEVPVGATVLFSAHGVAPTVRQAAEARRLKVVDATCPFVERVHRAAHGFAARGLPVIVIGNPAHAEVKGIVGEVGAGAVAVFDPHGAADFAWPGVRRVGVVSQTTMNADEVSAAVARLRRDFEVETTAEVCQATKVRQEAVRAFCRRRTEGGGDVAVLVLGSPNSSNTRRLCEIASAAGVRTFRAGTADEVRALDLAGVTRLGVTSGASTPEDFFSSSVAALEAVAAAGGRA